MLFAAAVSALSIVSVVSAQSIIPVQVGSTATAPGGIFQFIPTNVTAKQGDIVSFQFIGNPGNHSVTQSSFADPCNPLAGGFDSGNIFININGTEPVTPTFNVTITDATKPIWFFCKQLQPQPHCGHGMVGAINPPASGNTFDKFQSAAEANGTVASKVGQAQGGLVGVGASASVGVQSQSAITIFTGPAPSATAPAGNSTGNSSASGSAPAKTPGAATDVAVNSVTVFISAILGAFFL